MKLSTFIVSMAVTVGAATSASAAVVTVSESYVYSGSDGVDATVYTPVALSDLTIAGFDFGGVAKGTYTDFVGDPEFGTFPFSISVTSGGVTTTKSYTSLTDLDVNAGPFAEASISTGVPEPATWGMMLLGFIGLGAFAVRKQRSVAKLA